MSDIDTVQPAPIRKKHHTWVLWIVLLLGVWAAIVYFGDVQKIVATLLRGEWRLVSLAFAIQIASYLVYAAVYRSAFATVNIPSNIWHVVVVYLESLLVSIVVPASNILFFISYAKRSDQSTTKAAVALFFVRIADIIAFCLFFAVGIVYLLLNGQLQSFEIVGAGALFVIMITLVLVMMVFAYRPLWLRSLLRFATVVANGLFGWINDKTLFTKDWAGKVAHQFGEGARNIVANATESKKTFAWAAASHLLDLLTIFILFLSFHYIISPGVLLSGFVMGLLFVIIPITPQGIGTAEGIMIVTYHHLGVPTEIATVVTLAFRGLSFWLPAALGFILLQRRTLMHHLDNLNVQNQSSNV